MILAREPKILIAKARRPKWKTTRTYKRVSALAKNMGAAVRTDFVRGIHSFKSGIDPEKIYRAWMSGDWQKVMTTIPWVDLPGKLDPVAERLNDIAVESGTFSIDVLPAPVQSSLRYDVENPRIADFFSKRTAEMVVGIQSDTEEVIRTATTRAFTEARSPKDIADDIKSSIGLTPRYANALSRYKQGLMEKSQGGKGYNIDQIQKLVNLQEDKYLDYRAISIARTESRLATNYGQLYVWQEASNQDLIDSHTAKKVWIVDGDPCEICLPMDGVAVGLAEAWLLNTGDLVDIPTESHPNCECGMELDFGSSREKMENNEPWEDY